MENLTLWESVQTTDPNFTKEFNRGGFKGTAVNATWLVRRATETFGPVGIGWGYSIIDESYHDGHAFLNDKGEQIGRAVIHKIRLEVWYIWNGSLGRVQQFGQTEFVGRNKNGIFTDEEAPKKSLTDALGKCLSIIGFAADVHMGMFDDSKYVNSLKSSFAVNTDDGKKTDTPKAEIKSPPGITKFREEQRAFLKDMFSCTDYDQYVAFANTNDAKAFVEKARTQFPNDWNGDGGDIKGLRQQMLDFCNSLKATQRQAAE